MTSTEGHVWLITGANRGIGLEMARQLLQAEGNSVIAGVRTPSKATALMELQSGAKGKLYIVRIDITEKDSVCACADEVARLVGDKGVDYIVNNAAVNIAQEDYAFTADIEVLQKVFFTNVAGPAYVAHAFLPLLEKSKKKSIVNISSTLGSLNADFGAYHTSYSISKAALNMLTYKQAKERPDITAISMCPGWLQTDMGGANATLPVSIGVSGVLKTIASLTPEKSGLFFNYKGEQVPW
ncbi:NAD-P-binding protein [Fomes fomentarius]|nr:NAD-P-binding protein [Fomes fomentarius]